MRTLDILLGGRPIRDGYYQIGRPKIRTNGGPEAKMSSPRIQRISVNWHSAALLIYRVDFYTIYHTARLLIIKPFREQRWNIVKVSIQVKGVEENFTQDVLLPYKVYFNHVYFSHDDINKNPKKHHDYGLSVKYRSSSPPTVSTIILYSPVLVFSNTWCLLVQAEEGFKFVTIRYIANNLKGSTNMNLKVYY